MEELSVAIHFLELILGNNGNATIDGLADLYKIKSGNKKVILEHLKAINSIINDAIDYLESEVK